MCVCVSVVVCVKRELVDSEAQARQERPEEGSVLHKLSACLPVTEN